MGESRSSSTSTCGCVWCGSTHRGPDCALERLASRVALDLHDGVAQTLTLALLGIVESDAAPGGAVATCDAAACKESIARALGQIRMIIEDLQPRMYAEADTGRRIDAALSEFEIETGVKVQRRLDMRDFVGLGRATEITTFRIIQECLNNIRRHAMASCVTLTVERSADVLHVMVSDDGNGVHATDHEGSDTKHHGMGLAGMRSRVEFLSGTLRLDSDGRRGTTVDFTIPLAEEYADG